MMPLLSLRVCYGGIFFIAVFVAISIVVPLSSFALDPLPCFPLAGSLRIPLLSYNRVPISKLLSDPTSYHLREIRVAGTLRTPETQLMTRGCGVPYELTTISLEGESGLVRLLDIGACGLFVQVVEGTKTDEPGTLPEVIVLWIDRAHD